MLVCEECVRLTKVWYDAVAEFSDCLGRLEACRLDGFGFEDHHKATELAREKAETARASLRTHRAEHEPEVGNESGVPNTKGPFHA